MDRTEVFIRVEAHREVELNDTSNFQMQSFQERTDRSTSRVFLGDIGEELYDRLMMVLLDIEEKVKRKESADA